LGDLGVDNIKMVSKLFQSFLGQVYTATTSTHAEYYAVSYAVFKKYYRKCNFKIAPAWIRRSDIDEGTNEVSEMVEI
jgi:hypothetical protein